MSVQGYHGALYVNPADLTKLSPSRIQVLEEQGRARIVAENVAKEAEREAHMKQKYGENFDCKFESYSSPWFIPFEAIPHWPQGKLLTGKILGRKDRSRYNRFMDSIWEKLHKMRSNN